LVVPVLNLQLVCLVDLMIDGLSDKTVISKSASIGSFLRGDRLFATRRRGLNCEVALACRTMNLNFAEKNDWERSNIAAYKQSVYGFSLKRSETYVIISRITLRNFKVA
jgi:hypothetical protein